ncbi:hypothetical protein [Micromonospora sp. NPDC050200]|uniref:hypothetical protein n=1 Tax=Micromonospora sp. NPDC050200 TaxID=3155664 RepID=UPI0033E183BE
MEISLDLEQVKLLAAVDDGRVHRSPRARPPDFEKDPVVTGAYKRATQRLATLIKMRLVELDGGDDNVTRRWKLTGVGERVLAEAREQPADAAAEPADDPPGPNL